jgi:hypothetical protein
MNKTNEYSIHPYCFIFAQPASTAAMLSVDCAEQARQAQVYNDDGFIYSEYKQTGAGKPLKVGYRFPKDFTPASADTFLIEVLVEDSEGHTYGSIVAGTILSPTKIKPAMYIQCGDRARGGDPRIVEATRAGLTYTTAATMKMCLNPELKHVVHIAGPEDSLPWVSPSSEASSNVWMVTDTTNELCNNPSKRAGTITSYLDIETCTLELQGTSNIGQG